ncbi:MAG TPA: peptidoglycan DD-metalloendopeptidase family protein [Saprospiraceae bacterium]|nr:peptidoglycan DD-metalloendopeptidase family protein [Saprospiraceae bacterium]
MKKIFLSFIFLFIIGDNFLFSQKGPLKGITEKESVELANCLSESQRNDIKLMLAKNIQKLKQEGLIIDDPSRDNLNIAFEWPLRKKEALDYCGYYFIGNFVDHDPSTGISDYNCGNRTYDGHQGTDIATWPFPWYIYENNYVEVIAGEDGTIIGKYDGNDDDHCSCLGDWNAIFIMHADGSQAWYGHMKKNSLNSKVIGQTVVKGEYLGVVASSGCSSGPHLHIEFYDKTNKLIDPYYGECNNLNSWWATQEAYRVPTLNAALTHDSVPVHGCPGTAESPHFCNSFKPNQTIYTAIYFRDLLKGDVYNMKLRKPDNSIWQNWKNTASYTDTYIWTYWSWILPPSGPFGTWKFEVDFNGKTCIHEFEFSKGTSLVYKKEENIKLFPNPTNGRIEITGADKAEMQIIDIYGRVLKQQQLLNSYIDISELTEGTYFILLHTDDKFYSKQIIKM